MGTSIAAGIGIAGGLTAVRFRTTLRDPRDIVFIFAALGVGMACGAQTYGVAITATLIFAGGSLLLHHAGHGTRRQPDGLLRFIAPARSEAEAAIAKILRSYCRTFVLVTLREAAQGTAMEHAYQISVRAAELRSPLVSSLQAAAAEVDERAGAAPRARALFVLEGLLRDRGGADAAGAALGGRAQLKGPSTVGLD